MLNNAVTAQYTHTLTVTERLGGQYQCNVTNNKPSTATAQLTVQGTLIKMLLFLSLQISIAQVNYRMSSISPRAPIRPRL